MTLFSDPQSRGYAAITGTAYLGIAVFGGFAIAYVPSQIIVPGDAAATLANIIARRGLYLSGIGADVVVMLLEVMALSLLYHMFRPVSATLSFAAAMARLGMVAVMAAMLFFHAGALALAEPGATLGHFSDGQRADLAGLLLQMHKSGVWIWQMFFALHLILLGWLVAASGRFPRLLGMAMMLGAAGYAVDSIHAFAVPDAVAFGYLKIALLVIVTLAEIGFALWLLLVGPRPAAARPA
ncbi:MAG: DUF4386 domain-containing protein [Rhodobacteraceae bacterium]|nr:DUF4386 domain-containing protein [Paracoccaceae bacterium]